jgi:peroxiredoxin
MKACIDAGTSFPPFTWPLVGGGELTPARASGWRMLVVYRGKHCGLCREYLAELNSMREQFMKAEVDVFAVSADPEERAQAQVNEGKLKIPVAYGLDVAQMRALGLYVSPAEPGEVDWPFAEPGIYVINSDDRVQVVNVSNAPFARPGLPEMLKGIVTAREKQAPVHGTFEAEKGDD